MARPRAASSRTRSACRSVRPSPASTPNRWPRPRSHRCTRRRWPMAPGGGQGTSPGHREADRRRHRPAQFAGRAGRAHPPARRQNPAARSGGRGREHPGRELDLQREGANASVLRRFWENSDDLYVPEVIWSHTAERALTLERVGHSVRRHRRAGQGRHRPQGAGRQGRAGVLHPGVPRQLFHADAHAGNIWVDTDPARRANPRFIALDFGIMGQLAGRSVLPGRELHGHLQP